MDIPPQKKLMLLHPNTTTLFSTSGLCGSSYDHLPEVAKPSGQFETLFQ